MTRSCPSLYADLSKVHILNLLKQDFVLITVLLATLFLPFSYSIAGSLDKFNRYDSAGLLYLDESGKVIKEKRARDLFVPASTTKLVTAYLALKYWGEDYRFKTDFFLDDSTDSAILWVKGYGDPFLVSEELTIIAGTIATKLQERGISRLGEIRLDTTYFAGTIKLPGTASSNNPYDAYPGALAANFNTIFARRKNGDIVSAEEQTPITATARLIYNSMKGQSERINTGPDHKIAERYFAELLAEFLRRKDIEVEDEISWGEIPSSLPLAYRHLNSRPLASVIKPMMEYSTNFIANQLALKLGAEYHGAPASSAKVTQTFNEQLTTEFGWKFFFLEDGAGLSRANKISPAQLVDVLGRFRNWKHLLPEIGPGIYAKSGSLIGISALAGYIKKQDEYRPFAVIINQKTPYRFRNKLAVELSKQTD